MLSLGTGLTVTSVPPRMGILWAASALTAFVGAGGVACTCDLSTLRLRQEGRCEVKAAWAT